MKLGIYSSAFNLIKNNFDYDTVINNWLKIADTICIAVNTSEDDTYEKLEELYEKHPLSITIFKTQISYDDPDFDGKIKNEALLNCNADILLALDMDEMIPINVKEKLHEYAALLNDSNVSCFMLPSIDLYKDLGHYKKIGHKWYLHKKKDCYRGTVNFAKNADGTHDTSKSDSCELIDKEGYLVQSWSPIYGVYNASPPEIHNFVLENQIPYILHLGYVDLKRRDELNKNFWNKAWEVESGTPRTGPSLEELEKINYYKHNFNLNF